MGITEATIFEQFPYWQAAIAPTQPLAGAEITVFLGCGSSYNLALSLAVLANAKGRPAIAVPAGEWLDHAQNYWPNWRAAQIVALSRSGETTETVAAAKLSRSAGAFVTAITAESGSALTTACDRLVFAQTHPAEGIVMTASASLMLLLGTQLLGYSMAPTVPGAAQHLLDDVDARLPALIGDRSHFVFLGGGALHGIALEAALKVMEMSQVFTQAFHPLEYRHGPISLVDERTLAVMLYGAAQPEIESRLVSELQDKGAKVIGFGGPGDLSFAVPAGPTAGLIALPALQLLGERVAQSHNIDTVAPRHLTKVVTLA